MKSAPDKTLNPIWKVQIVKCLLFGLPFLSPEVNAQSNYGTGLPAGQAGSAIATATVISDIVGADQFENMSFTDIKPALSNGNMINKGHASFDLIGDNYTYDLTLPDEEIVLAKKDIPSTLKVGAFRATKGNVHPGRETIVIDAILRGREFEAGGNYASVTPLVITVNYN